MNILVLIKQVADTEARIVIKEDGKSLEVENKFNVNFFDEFAVEEAIRLRDRVKESQVSVVTCGGKKAVEALRTAVAMGADKASLIDNTGLSADDALVTARILAAFARKEGYDLILCGRQAIDDENANIGAMVAEYLGIPHLSAVTAVENVDSGAVRVVKEMEGGKEVVEAKLPALLTAQKGLNEPRVPLITGVMKAMKAVIPTFDPLSLGLSKEEIAPEFSAVEVLSYEPPKGRPPVKIVEGETTEEKVRNLVTVLRNEAKVL